MKVSPYVLPGIPHAALRNAMQALPARITGMVAKEFGISEGALIMKLRTDDICEARQVAIYLLLNRGRMNQHRIAKMFYRHHTTVMHSLQTMRDRMDTEPDFKKRVEKLMDSI